MWKGGTEGWYAVYLGELWEASGYLPASDIKTMIWTNMIVPLNPISHLLSPTIFKKYIFFKTILEFPPFHLILHFLSNPHPKTPPYHLHINQKYHTNTTPATVLKLAPNSLQNPSFPLAFFVLPPPQALACASRLFSSSAPPEGAYDPACCTRG